MQNAVEWFMNSGETDPTSMIRTSLSSISNSGDGKNNRSISINKYETVFTYK